MNILSQAWPRLSSQQEKQPALGFELVHFVSQLLLLSPFLSFHRVCHYPSRSTLPTFYTSTTRHPISNVFLIVSLLCYLPSVSIRCLTFSRPNLSCTFSPFSSPLCVSLSSFAYLHLCRSYLCQHSLALERQAGRSIVQKHERTSLPVIHQSSSRVRDHNVFVARVEGIVTMRGCVSANFSFDRKNWRSNFHFSHRDNPPIIINKCHRTLSPNSFRRECVSAKFTG